MKIYLMAFLATAAAALMLVGGFLYWREQTAPKEAEQRVSALESMEKVGLPDFEATTLSGEKLRLQDFKGKAVILNFWASWCAPCVEEFPSMIQLVEQMKGDVILIAVSGDSSREDIDNFLVNLDGWKNPNVKIIWDEDRALTKLYDVERLPESYVANRELKMTKKIIGSVDWFTPDSVEYVKGVLAQ